ncbi:MAG: hypothetical protein ACE5IK_05570 [Acidobacteriota bacterium]
MTKKPTLVTLMAVFLVAGATAVSTLALDQDEPSRAQVRKTRAGRLAGNRVTSTFSAMTMARYAQRVATAMKTSAARATAPPDGQPVPLYSIYDCNKEGAPKKVCCIQSPKDPISCNLFIAICKELGHTPDGGGAAGSCTE